MHELGHVTVGVWVGFRFNSLRIGPLRFDRPFRISLYRGKGTGASGWASMFPVRQDGLVLRAVAMLLAGPTANFLSAAALVLLPFPKGVFPLALICVSILLGSVNLIPFRSKALLSDGARVLMLLWNRERGERLLAMLRLGAELGEGVMPESWSPAYLAKATALVDNSPDTVTAHVFAYSAAFHQHKDTEAAQMLEICLRYSGFTAPVMREALMSDAATFQARKRKRLDLAEQWLSAMPEATEISWFRTEAEAGVAEAKGDIAGALNKLDEAERQILAAPNRVQREMSLRLLQRWKSELQNPAGAHAVSRAGSRAGLL